MASLFTKTSGDLRVLDPGAGAGSLTAALVERLCSGTRKPRSVSLYCYEIDELLGRHLGNTLRDASEQLSRAQIQTDSTLNGSDFIFSNASGDQGDIFSEADSGFTHVIMNPPYKKINSASAYRTALRRAGIETSNLYTGFMFLAMQRLRTDGEMVAIVPRSFCNGPYFKPFREKFFSVMVLRHIHVFEKRNSAFKSDDVLQENIIIHATKGGRPSEVKITTSRDANFEIDPDNLDCVAEDMTQRATPYQSVIRPNDSDRFVRVMADDLEQAIADRMAQFNTTLSDLRIEVSTGPVVDFRLKNDLRAQPEEETAPLLYPAHFRHRSLVCPKAINKANAIKVSDTSRKWLWKNTGHFVVTRRFTSKEERRRITASVYSSELPGEFIGFENHLNVFHAKQAGMPRNLAFGLSVYLNSSIVDRFFRQFNGHTQVNAADLRSLHYPEREALERIGKQTGDAILSQYEIDNVIERELAAMTDDVNPLDAQRKIDEALSILKALRMPKGQQNERSALTLLALLDLKPSGKWNVLKRPLMGITPIMDYTRDQYGREYAPNTRETFRRQTMHQFVEAGIALYNPDKPARPVNSPNACYQISTEAYAAILTFGSDQWQSALGTYLEGQEALTAKWAKHREIHKIPVQIADDREISLTPGAHSQLVKEIIMEFAPRFAPGAEVIYVGDTGDKAGYFEEKRLAELGVAIDQHGKMPDVILHFEQKGWLLLIESVTSHGPVDAKRHNELAALFKDSKPGIVVYVTALPDRRVMGRHLNDISWETAVWCSDAPTHLIHFNGERFLGPYK